MQEYHWEGANGGTHHLDTWRVNIFTAQGCVVADRFLNITRFGIQWFPWYLRIFCLSLLREAKIILDKPYCVMDSPRGQNVNPGKSVSTLLFYFLGLVRKKGVGRFPSLFFACAPVCVAEKETREQTHFISMVTERKWKEKPKENGMKSSEDKLGNHGNHHFRRINK